MIHTKPVIDYSGRDLIAVKRMWDRHSENGSGAPQECHTVPDNEIWHITHIYVECGGGGTISLLSIKDKESASGSGGRYFINDYTNQWNHWEVDLWLDSQEAIMIWSTNAVSCLSYVHGERYIFNN